MSTVYRKMKQRRDTAANFAAVVLTSGELAFTTDTKKLVVGDGATAGGIPVTPIFTTEGDFIYGGAAGVQVRLPIGDDDDALVVFDGLPAWMPNRVLPLISSNEVEGAALLLDSNLEPYWGVPIGLPEVESNDEEGFVLALDSNLNPVWASQAQSSGSGTVNSGTAGQLACYAASAAAVSGTVLPKFELAGTNNVSAYTLYNAMTYPFAKTDTTPRNIFWCGSNDASNPFGISFNATGHGSTASSRVLKMDIGGIGANEMGVLNIAAYSTLFRTREGTGNTGLSLVTTDALTTISHEQSNGAIKLSPAGSGGVQLGRASYSTTTHSIYGLLTYPFGKSDTSGRNGLFVGSNDSSNPWGLIFNFTGNGTATSREVIIKTTEVGSNSSGKIRFGATSFNFYSNDDATLALSLNTAGQVCAEQTTAATSTTDGALRSKGGISAAGSIVCGGSFKGGTPTGGTAAAWTPGIKVVSGTSTLNTGEYVQLDIGGTLVKLATVTNS